MLALIEHGVRKLVARLQKLHPTVGKNSLKTRLASMNDDLPRTPSLSTKRFDHRRILAPFMKSADKDATDFRPRESSARLLRVPFGIEV